MGLFSQIKKAVSKTTTKISGGITDIFNKKKLDSEALEELENLLLSADLGIKATEKFIENLKKQKFNKDVTSEEIKTDLADMLAVDLRSCERSIQLCENGPTVILVCGVNGNGKTTTIGKLAHQYINAGKKVALVACDTYRAAAVAQLQVWAERCGADFIAGEEAADPASVAYKATAAGNDYDLIFIDTAGRLQNKQNLMAELTKISKVVGRNIVDAPHYSILVLDATTGQNAHSQLEHFKEAAAIDGLIVTKLDGSAKAGVVVGLAQNHDIPIYYIGLGEKIDDLRPFNAKDFAYSLIDMVN